MLNLALAHFIFQTSAAVRTLMKHHTKFFVFHRRLPQNNCATKVLTALRSGSTLASAGSFVSLPLAVTSLSFES